MVVVEAGQERPASPVDLDPAGRTAGGGLSQGAHVGDGSSPGLDALAGAALDLDVGEEEGLLAAGGRARPGHAAGPTAAAGRTPGRRTSAHPPSPEWETTQPSPDRSRRWALGQPGPALA